MAAIGFSDGLNGYISTKRTQTIITCNNRRNMIFTSRLPNCPKLTLFNKVILFDHGWMTSPVSSIPSFFTILIYDFVNTLKNGRALKNLGYLLMLYKTIQSL